ncbi:MAG: hypothetical protein OXU41_09400 [Gammaproteobacteria bacterium]|nr:hypothetical protein [Gammaproteobacteria bacterium]
MHDSVVLGLHGFSSHSEREMHDAGICIVRNGEVVAAMDEERLTRRKRDGSFPLMALASGLAIAGLRPSDITDVAFVDRRTPWQALHVWKYAASAFFRTGANPCRYLAFWTRRMLDYRRLPPAGTFPGRVRFYEHHLCHAASAYYPGPWPEATIVSLDGMGDFSVGGMTARGSGGDIRILCRCNGYFSPGHFYMILTQYLGFTPGRHEGKVTGLAAHGNPAKAYRAMRRVIRYRKGKLDFSTPLVAEEFFNVIRGGRAERRSQQNAGLRKFRKLWAPFSPEDIAAAGQARFEDVICDYVRDAVALAGRRNLVVAGGCFANVRLNQKIMELPEVNGVYVHPNMGDGGLSAGAALLHHHKNAARRGYAQKPWPDVYLGPAYSMAEIEAALRAGGVAFEKIRPADVAGAAAKNLASGKIVAWFHGRMEYGPRALGNRSILAAADNPGMPGRLNSRLGRTDFMPFAPVILDEHAGGWLDGWERNHTASRFMTVTYNINPRKRALIPAVVHVDGTARPQVLTKQCNPLLHQVITRYYQLTGIPLLINTSFNMHEEPIVCSPADAIESFKRGAADLLFIGRFAVAS